MNDPDGPRARRLQHALIGAGVLLLAVWAAARVHAVAGSRRDQEAFDERRASRRGGNVALSAHRDGFFRVLKDVAVGDDLVLATPAETLRHVVAWTKVVAPEDVSVLDPAPTPALPLVTCPPFHFVCPAPRQFIVRAHRVPAPRDQAPAGAVERRHS